jgi:mono/diheme cytochrome c family protein
MTLQFMLLMLFVTLAELCGPTAALAATAVDGGAIFKEHCGYCHGEDGKGKAAVGTPDFTSPKIQGSLTNEDIITVITNGKKGTIMPAWKGQLSTQEIAAVASYVRSLGRLDGKREPLAGTQPHTQAQAAEIKPPNEYTPGGDDLLSFPTDRVCVNFADRFVIASAFSGPARWSELRGLDWFLTLLVWQPFQPA